jgi:benzil reductase ((S)-benzoin forming)
LIDKRGNRTLQGGNVSTEIAENRTVLITGASSGIGHALCSHYLGQGWNVLGLSRRRPEDLCSHPRFGHRSLDLADIDSIQVFLPELLNATRHLELVILNAGVLGRFGDLRDADIEDLEHTMRVNVWCNTFLFDILHRLGVRYSQVVAISSGASVSGNRGWSGYSVSKAALNMLVKLLAAENPDAHFCSIAPGLVDTAMQETLCTHPEDDRFPTLQVLRSKRGTSEMPSSEEAAILLAGVLSSLPDLCASGDYIDLRKPPF